MNLHAAPFLFICLKYSYFRLRDFPAVIARADENVTIRIPKR